MLAQLVDADPGTFETFILIALVAMIVALVLNIAKRGESALIALIGWCVFIASYLWLT